MGSTRAVISGALPRAFSRAAVTALLWAAVSLIALVTSAYRAAQSGESIPPEVKLSVAVNQLSAIEGDLLPAVRVGAATGPTPPSATAALDAIERDANTPDLADLLRDWPQIYGALTLLEQAAPQN